MDVLLEPEGAGLHPETVLDAGTIYHSESGPSDGFAGRAGAEAESP